MKILLKKNIKLEHFIQYIYIYIYIYQFILCL